jgi:hypothetical protein
MKEMRIFFVFLSLIILISACQTTDKIIEDSVGDRDYPLPKVIEPIAGPVAEPVMETADEVLKERTVADTRRPGKKGGYKATIFPKSESTADEGTAFKLSW